MFARQRSAYEISMSSVRLHTVHIQILQPVGVASHAVEKRVAVPRVQGCARACSVRAFAEKSHTSRVENLFELSLPSSSTANINTTTLTS